MEEPKLYEVRTPNQGFNGIRYGVKFKNGVGQATKKQAEVLAGNWKYKCAELENEKKAGKKPPEPKPPEPNPPVPKDDEKSPASGSPHLATLAPSSFAERKPIEPESAQASQKANPAKKR